MKENAFLRRPSAPVPVDDIERRAPCPWCNSYDCVCQQGVQSMMYIPPLVVFNPQHQNLFDAPLGAPNPAAHSLMARWTQQRFGLHVEASALSPLMNTQQAATQNQMPADPADRYAADYFQQRLAAEADADAEAIRQDLQRGFCNFSSPPNTDNT